MARVQTACARCGAETENGHTTWCLAGGVRPQHQPAPAPGMTYAERTAIEAEMESTRRHVAMLLSGCELLPSVLACARRLVRRLERLERRAEPGVGVTQLRSDGDAYDRGVGYARGRIEVQGVEEMVRSIRMRFACGVSDYDGASDFDRGVVDETLNAAQAARCCA